MKNKTKTIIYFWLSIINGGIAIISVNTNRATLSFIAFVLFIISMAISFYYDSLKSKKEYCDNCEWLHCKTNTSTQKIRELENIYRCYSEAYCERTMKTIDKGKNRQLSLETPKWCPKKLLRKV